nr:MAG TPA: hypothetical protein [Caudoviricetes sp.]
MRIRRLLRKPKRSTKRSCWRLIRRHKCIMN